MRRDKRADRERVLHDRQCSAGVPAPEFEGHADRAQEAFLAAAGLHDGQRRNGDTAHVYPSLEFRCTLLFNE